MTVLASGAHVGKYVLVREIGRGAMATVFEARHVDLEKRVALKTMHPHLAADPTAAARFLREGKAAAQIRNAHVVDIFDVGTHDEVPYLVMELIEGTDLGAHLRDHGKLAPREIADLMLPICSAVADAHAVGVIHRDLKPSNIMLARSDDDTLAPTVLDFGISKLERDPADDLTASEVLLGTVHYMSPERTRGVRTQGALADVYSLGVILYECATGAKPFAGSTPYALMHAIVSTKVVAPSTLTPSVPRAFDEIVLRAMNRDPSKRFDSARALGAALFPLASDGARRAWAEEFGGEANAERGHSRRLVWLLVATAAPTILFVAARKSEKNAPPHLAATTTQASVATTSATRAVVPEPAPAPTASASNPHADAVEATSSSRLAPRATGHALRNGARATPDASALSDERGTNGAPIVE